MIPFWLKRWLGLFSIMLAASAVTAAAAEAPASPERIVAIGDLHGDHAVWRAIARSARLVDGKGRWVGQRAVLVQTGDIVDRGSDSLKIIRDLMRLEREARRAGGRVVVLVGNHEAMMVSGDYRYVHPGEIAAFADRRSARRREDHYRERKTAIEAAYRQREPGIAADAIRSRWLAATPLGMVEHRAAWSPQGELGRWVIARPAVVKLGTSLFVHGGLSSAYASVPIADINRRVAATLAARETAPTAIINDPLGPLWYRGLTDMGAETASIGQQLDHILAATGARRVVIGHTPLTSGVAVQQDGKLVRVDSGNSHAYGGVPGYVEIVGDTVTTHDVARPSP